MLPAALRTAAAVALTAGCLASDLAAQDVYGLRQEGRISWNGTLLDKLPGDFDDDHGFSFVFVFSSGFPSASFGGFFFVTSTGLSSDDFDDRWTDSLVVGSDRWSLRADGRLERNGVGFASLSHAWFTADWTALDVADGRVHAVRRDGRTSRASTAGGTLLTLDVARDDSFFTDVLGADGDTFVLRADGAVFSFGDPDEPRVVFDGGPGPSGFPDGEAADSTWTELTFDPATDRLLALRRDGLVFAAPIEGLQGLEEPTELARLPAPDGSAFVDVYLEQLVFPRLDEYADLVVLDEGGGFPGAGDWLALRGDGTIFTTGGAALVDHAGDGAFSDLATLGPHFATIDRQGQVFVDAEPEPRFNLPKTGYTRTALAFDPPDVTAAKNGRPVVTRYKVTLVEGQTAEIPVLATDTNLSSDALLVEAVEPLPAGVTFDADQRVFVVDGTQPKGGAALRVRVDDGVAKPRTTRLRLRVVPPDTAPKNRRPVVARVGTVRALVGAELELPLIVSDRDGDVVTLTPDTTKGLFAVTDATFDAATNTLRWTPTFDDIGRSTARFTVTDGTVERRLRVKLQVKTPLPDAPSDP